MTLERRNITTKKTKKVFFSPKFYSTLITYSLNYFARLKPIHQLIWTLWLNTHINRCFFRACKIQSGEIQANRKSTIIFFYHIHIKIWLNFEFWLKTQTNLCNKNNVIFNKSQTQNFWLFDVDIFCLNSQLGSCRTIYHCKVGNKLNRLYV